MAIDGSVIALPSSPAIFEAFGEEKVTNQKGGFSQSYAQAQCSVLYDLLNHLSLKAQLDAYRTSELSQARDLCAKAVRSGDIIIADRGYASTPFMSCALGAGADFVVRLPTKSFKQSWGLFTDKKVGRSVRVERWGKHNWITQRRSHQGSPTQPGYPRDRRTRSHCHLLAR